MDINKKIFTFLKEHKWEAFVAEFTDNNIDVNLRDEQDNYLIQYAVLYQQKDIIDMLIKKGCKLDMLDKEGHSIVYSSVKYNYKDILQSLLSYAPQQIGIHLADYQDKEGNLPLHYSIKFNNIDAFQMLLPKSNPNMRDADDNNALHLAIPNLQMVQLLLQTNVNLGHQNNDSHTPLHLACVRNNNQIITALVNHMDARTIDIQDARGKTTMMYLIENDNLEMVKLLLEKKVPVTTQDVAGNTPLHYAIEKQHPELVHLLVAQTPNFNHLNIDGQTPLHTLLAINANLNSYPVETLLANTNLNIQDSTGNTVLHHLAKLNAWERYTEILAGKKMNIFIKNRDNQTVTDIIKNKEAFLALVALSYYNLLQHKDHVWMEGWENQCNAHQTKKPRSKEECLKLIEKVLPKHSLPVKKDKYCVEIDINERVDVSSFVGYSLDVISGCLLLEEQKGMMTCLTKDFVENTELTTLYNKLGYIKNTKAEFFNFEIMYVFNNLVFPTNMDRIIKAFKKSPKRFLAMPLGIELSHGAHANMLVYDKETNSMERFEPNGANPPYSFHYKDAHLDKQLLQYFRDHFKDMSYLKPEDFLPVIGFQANEEVDVAKRIGDPGGFCVVWSIWYALQRARYPYIAPAKLVKKLIGKIKMKNIYFRDYIRSFAKEITDRRASLLKDIDINDWINNTVTEKQMKEVIGRIMSRAQDA